MNDTNKEQNLENVINDVEQMNIEQKDAVRVKKGWLPVDYTAEVKSLLDISFEPDEFQKQAFYLVKNHHSIFVAAHTSSGKTLIADYAVSLSIKSNSRCIYTSPIKALSNQKYYDFKKKFGDCGIITGDIQMNTESKCLVMTTEILRNMLYRDNEILQDLEYVVFDEVHYINDPDRGVIWEECIIMLPEYVTIIMLSATISNTLEFSKWVGKTRNCVVYVIETEKRVIPLNHLIFKNEHIYDYNGKWVREIECNKKQYYGKIMEKRNKKPDDYKINVYKQEKRENLNIFSLLNFLKFEKLFPTICFCFSKRKCEELAKNIGNLITPTEKTRIEEYFKLTDNLDLPQVKIIKKMCINGVGVHHSDLLPILKEIVEFLFSEGLIKILFATETFAMGINMPAKCVVFFSLKKFTQETRKGSQLMKENSLISTNINLKNTLEKNIIFKSNFRFLNSSEYTQMSGRAGRRGIDTKGIVLISGYDLPPQEKVKNMIYGSPVPLSSKFKLTHGMILSLLIKNFKIEEIMRKSFGESYLKFNEKNLLNELLFLKQKRTELKEKIKITDELKLFFNDYQYIVENNKKILKKYGNMILKPETIIYTNSNIIFKLESKNLDIFSVKFLYKKNFNEFLYDENKIHNSSKKNNSDDKEENQIKENNKIPGEIKMDDIIFILNPDFSLNFNYGEGTDVLTILNIKNKIENLKKTMKNIELKDFELMKQINLTESRIKKIENILGDENLKLFDEYFEFLNFLKIFNYFDENVTIKGRFASEIKTLNEILITELIFNNDFKDCNEFVIIPLLT